MHCIEHFLAYFRALGILMTISYLGANDRAASVLFVQHPRKQGEWCSQHPSVVRVFGVIIRHAPEDAGRTTPKQTGHFSHYNTKLANSRFFQWNSCHIALTERDVSLILLLEIF